MDENCGNERDSEAQITTLAPGGRQCPTNHACSEAVQQQRGDASRSNKSPGVTPTAGVPQVFKETKASATDHAVPKPHGRCNLLTSQEPDSDGFQGFLD